MAQTYGSRAWMAIALLTSGSLIELFIGIFFFGNRAIAQSNILPDETLDLESSVVLTDVEGLPVEIILGGATREQNLFHSFEEFNISQERAALFFIPDGTIQNVLARVTGSNRSEILGTLGTFELVDGEFSPTSANFFLINPNGIIFGPEASLAVGGSFVSTTANAIQFGDRGFFSASVPDVPSPLLTVNPSALVFNQLNPGGIENRSVAPAGIDPSGGVEIFGLRVLDGKSLLLVGGDVLMDGGQLHALGGRIELGGVFGGGTVELNIDQDNFSLSFPDSLARANVALTNRAVIDVVAGGGGSVAINAEDVNFSGESNLFSGIGQGLGSPDSQAGDVEITATGTVTLSGMSVVSSGFSGGTGSNGNLSISAERVNIFDGSIINSSTFGLGDAGNIRVQANDTIAIAGSGIDGRPSSVLSGIASTSETTAIGRGGDISLQAQRIVLADSGQVAASNLSGQGRAGNIQVDAGESFSLMGGALLQSLTIGQGDAGNIAIRAGNTVQLDGFSADGTISSINSSVGSSSGEVGNGRGGDIRINTQTLHLTNTASITTEVKPGSTGTGGNITLEVERLAVEGGAEVSASTFGEGDAGNLLIQAGDTVEVFGISPFNSPSILTTQVNPGARGRGGNLTIATRHLSVRDGNQISTSTFGIGDAGNLTIRADQSLEVVGTSPDGQFFSSLSAGVGATSVGIGGDLTIATDNLVVRDRAQVAVNSQGTGPAGSLGISARSILLDNQGKLTAETASGQGGNIRLRSQERLLLRNESRISTTAGTNLAGGDGGNITIDTPFIIAVPQENSDITANAFTGRGGRVEINAQGILGTQFRPRLTPRSDITASSTFGVNGVVEINTLNVDPSRGLVALPSNLVDASGLIAQGCSARNRTDTRPGEFIITGRGGLPPNPAESLNSEAVLTGWITPDSTTEANNQDEILATQPVNPDETSTAQETLNSHAGSAIDEAQGWMMSADGNLVLVSQTPVSRQTWFSNLSCNGS